MDDPPVGVLVDSHPATDGWLFLRLPGSGEVIAVVREVLLEHVTFLVNVEGWAAARDMRKPTYHAYCRGVVRPLADEAALLGPRNQLVRCSYHIQRGPTFFRGDSGQTVTAARAAILTGHGCFAADPFS